MIRPGDRVELTPKARQALAQARGVVRLTCGCGQPAVTPEGTCRPCHVERVAVDIRRAYAAGRHHR